MAGGAGHSAIHPSEVYHLATHVAKRYTQNATGELPGAFATHPTRLLQTAAGAAAGQGASSQSEPILCFQGGETLPVAIAARYASA